MPRRKKLPSVPDITDGGKNPETHLVQKANPLLTLSETGLTLAEFKILDAYLARIDSHKPEERFVRLERGAIEKYIGVTQIKSADLEKRIDNLFQTITIRDKNKHKGFTKIALFEKAVCYQDDNGLWQVDLAASPSAMEYIFNVENIGYLRYRLRNVVNLTSRYTYVLYLYLEQNRHMHLSWDIDIEQLKAILRCTADTYKSYKRFNDLILKKCQKELDAKTDCHFTYEPVKKNRRVVSIRFTLESAMPAVPQDEQADHAVLPAASGIPEAELYAEILPDAVKNAPGYDAAQLRDMILTAFPGTGPSQQMNWIRIAVNRYSRYAGRVKNHWKYFVKTLKEVLEAELKTVAAPDAGKTDRVGFCDGAERDTDYDTIMDILRNAGT